MSIDNRLAELGITLPAAAAAVASYVPFVEANGLLYISGQISFAEDGSLITGRVGEDLDLEAGQAAARVAGSCCWRNCAMRWGRSIGSNGSSNWGCSSIRPATSPTSPRSPMAHLS